jgi:hypothetical protein
MILITTEQRTSEPFIITSQVTIVAIGLQGTDTVEFDLVSITKSNPASGDPCCPGQVVLPEHLLLAPLTSCNSCCEGEARVKLTANKPWIVMDMPQQIPIVARVVAPDDAVISVEYFETTSQGIG